MTTERQARPQPPLNLPGGFPDFQTVTPAMIKEQATWHHRNEVVESLGKPGGFVEQNLRFLTPVEKIWQPSDLIPDDSTPEGASKVAELRKAAKELPAQLLAVIAGNIITEEALPSYESWLNRITAIRDRTGASTNAWPLWIRGWTAEENRHGTVLDRYATLCQRINIRALEKTTHYLIRNGFDPDIGDDPYEAVIFVADQEEGTVISHGGSATRAKEKDNMILYEICHRVQGDEKRHGGFYKGAGKEIVKIDPAGFVLALRSRMRKRVTMPAALMDDKGEFIPGTTPQTDLFKRFALAAQQEGIYTAADYEKVFAHLVSFWGIDTLSLSGEAEEAQAEICNELEHNKKVAERMSNISLKRPAPILPWVIDSEAA